MSGGPACSNRAHRPSWRVIQYRCNYSAFSGYRMTNSEYSGVACGDCGRYWRTKARYVEGLMKAGRTGHLKPQGTL